MSDDGWTLVTNQRNTIKKKLRYYQGGRFKNLIEATDHLVFSIYKGFAIEDLSEFQVELLTKRFGENWINNVL